MCGRYSFDDMHDIFEVRSIIEDVASRLGEDAAAAIKRGEVFPSETAAVVTGVDSGLCCDAMSWGYPLNQKSQLIINAKSENIFKLDMFKKSLGNKKCLIPCTGFFEWKHEEKRKIKYLIKPQEKDFFYLAGLYDSYFSKNGYINKFVIITALANEQMSGIHNRMPLIVHKELAGDWLHNKTDIKIIKEIFESAGRLEMIKN